MQKVIRYETKKMIHHQPPVHEVVEQRREVVACEDGCDGEIIIAPAPLHVLPKVKATEEFLSFLVVSKLDDRQKIMARYPTIKSHDDYKIITDADLNKLLKSVQQLCLKLLIDR